MPAMQGWQSDSLGQPNNMWAQVRAHGAHMQEPGWLLDSGGCSKTVAPDASVTVTSCWQMSVNCTVLLSPRPVLLTRSTNCRGLVPFDVTGHWYDGPPARDSDVRLLTLDQLPASLGARHAAEFVRTAWHEKDSSQQSMSQARKFLQGTKAQDRSAEDRAWMRGINCFPFVLTSS